MQFVRTFTYWFVGVNIVASTLFMIMALILGGRDLLTLLRALERPEMDDADDGRVTD